MASRQLIVGPEDIGRYRIKGAGINCYRFVLTEAEILKSS